MAGKMRFDLVSPECSVASMEVSAVSIPGSEGDFTAMPDHASFMTALRPGVVRVEGDSSGEFVVSGGFVEISATSATVLAESAYPRDKITREIVESLIGMAEESAKTCGDDLRDRADKHLADTRLLLDLL